MLITRRNTLATGAGLLGASMLPRLVRAADYPERPITVAMIAPAGGATDGEEGLAARTAAAGATAAAGDIYRGQGN